MLSNAFTPERCTDLPSDALYLGVDGENYEHYLSRYRQTIFILDDNQLDRTVNVHGRSLTTYGAWVSQTRGKWAEWTGLKHGLSELLDQVATEETPTAHSDD